MLRIDNLTKRYGERIALKSLSFAVPRGQFVALLGPNGAGKSTLFQVLTGLFAADEGSVDVAGHSLRTAATQPCVRSLFTLACWGYYPQRSFGELAKNGPPR